MDADRNIIPIVEGDQGEGFMDEIDPLDILEAPPDLADYEKLSKIAADVDLAKEGLKEEPQPHPPMLMQVGMTIHFYGYEYRVLKLMKRGRVTLKLIGRTPNVGKV